MSRLILHVGTHKTGTTAIQSFLASHRRELAAAGVHYPDSTRFVGSIPEAHHGVAAALATGAGPFPPALEKFRDHLRRALRDHDAVVLSSEAFYRHLLPADAAGSPDQWIRRDAYVARMGAYFADLSPTVSIYFRNPVALAESKYANNTVATPHFETFPDFLVRTADTFEYSRHLATFRRHFAAVQAQSYERSLSPSLIANFFADHGLPAPGAGDDRRLRISPKNQAVLWIQRLKSEGALADRERNRRWRFALADESQPLFEETSPSTFWAGAEARTAFFARYGDPVDGIAFAPPPAWLERPQTVWDDAMHAAAGAAYARWIGANAAEMRARERAGIPPYENADAPPRGEGVAARALRRLRSVRRRLAAR